MDNPTQVEGYRALLGLHEHRPFECVGEQAESLLAFTWITHQSEWRRSAVVTALVAEMPELTQPHPELEDQVLGERKGRLTLPTPFETLGSVLA